MSFTPGPWRVEWSFVGTPAECADDIMGPAGEHVVCFGHDYDDYGYISNNDDARLIAAAPELLDALKRVTRGYIGIEDVEVPEADMTFALAAIAKAEGRS